MRRILTACLLQTMRFDTVKDANARKDYEDYCERLKKSGTKFVVEEEKEEPDGSIVIKVKKQYNSYRTDGYID
ncbi:MAG: protein pyrBI [Lachnospiraceae bacterium]|nr:protein pyrBI [Lachnospiraceae bacterium]MDO5549552.1 protein pyrBI [Lachnospiraceae bacterium]